MKKTLAVRVINADKTSYGGFVNATKPGSVIVAPDWKPTKECGNGIHGWLWGIGRLSKPHFGNKIWQVVEVPDDGVDLGGKWKWKWVKVVYSGSQAECMKRTMKGRQQYIQKKSIEWQDDVQFSHTSEDKGHMFVSGNLSCVSVSGWRSGAIASGEGVSANASGIDGFAMALGTESAASTSNYGSIANASGVASSATTSENYSIASALGYCASVSTLGRDSPAIALGSDSSVNTSGISSPAICVGIGGKAKSGKYGCIVLGYIVDDHMEYACARIGNKPGELKADTWYEVDRQGNFRECTNE